MEFEILLSKLLRLSNKKAHIEFEKWMKSKKGTNTFHDKQMALDTLIYKSNFLKMIKEEVIQEGLLAVHLMSDKRSEFSDLAFNSTKGYPMVLWTELIGSLNSTQIEQLLANYNNELPSSIIEVCIVNLDEEKQVKVIEKYKDKLDSKNENFHNFYYCLEKKAKEKILELYPSRINPNPLLYLEDTTNSEELLNELENRKEKLKSVDMDKILELILLKSSKKHKNVLIEALKIFEDRIEEISDGRLNLYITRARYLNDKLSHEYDKDLDIKLFNQFKTRFRKMGLKETLAIFDVRINQYDEHKLGNEIIYYFRDTTYENETTKQYINDKITKTLTQKLKEEFNKKEYTVEEFEKLVAKVKVGNPQKLLHDDYIEAMVACGQLMKKRLITDENEAFKSLRKKFTNMIIDRVEKDATFCDNINLNGIFYRLVKGSLSFDKIFNIKTYKGLIYLSKIGITYNNPDIITMYLSDEQVGKLNIKPILGWRKSIIRKEKKKHLETLPEEEFNPQEVVSEFKERMLLQLLCYFGESKAKYILKSDMRENRMENLFDGLNYKEIKIDEEGNPITKEEVLNFFFGRGQNEEENSIMNGIINENLLDFGRYFSEVCNNYDEIKEKCNGIVTVKRILRLMESIPLAIELKPDEKEFSKALREMNTTDPDLLIKGVELCRTARERKASTIPKVKGTLGNFTYEMLDIKDPMALAVGYMSHCCFTVGGLSDSSLRHSMNSQNGRTFVVYNKGNFVTQSWVWRNGEVVCFDSVEAGSSRYGAYDDELSIVDVYEKAASEIIAESECNETEKEKIKFVTVGKADFKFEGLDKISIDRPYPYETEYLYLDSQEQSLLAGIVPKDPTYGQACAIYKDERKKVNAIFDMNKADPDDIDEIMDKYYSIKYQATGNDEEESTENINQLFAGEDWYIKTTKNGEVDAAILSRDERAVDECRKYAEILGIEIKNDYEKIDDQIEMTPEEVVKKLRLSKVSESRRG